MKYSLNKISLVLVLTFSSYCVFAQGVGHRIKATIRTNGTPGQVEVWATADFSNSTDYFDNINLTFAIPTNQASTNTAASVFSSDFSSIPVAGWAQQAVGIVNSQYIYTFVGNNTTVTASNFTTTEFRIATILFTDSTFNAANVSLVDFTSTSGAPTGQSYLYISLGSVGGVSPTSSSNKFYNGTGGTVGNNGTNYFVASNSTIILPVTLLSFTALKVGTGNSLNWAVTTETNFKEYDVERSGNGADFTAIGIIAAKNSPKYSYIDATPLSGINYYRLKMVDIDGKFKYSEVRTVLFDGTTVLFDIYPNPVVGGKLNINLQQYNYTGKAQLRIADISGRSIQSVNINVVKGSTQIAVPVKSLNTGTYFVTVYDSKGNIITETKKVVKQ